MKKHIMGENGISYTLGEDDLYYPDLYLPEETEYPIGKYGMLRKSYLKEHRKGLYLELVLSGKLNEHLHQVDEECKGYYTKHCRRVDWCNKHIDDFKKQYGLDDGDWRVIGVFILSQSLVSTEIYHKEIKMLTEKELSVSSIRNIY